MKLFILAAFGLALSFMAGNKTVYSTVARE